MCDLPEKAINIVVILDFVKRTILIFASLAVAIAILFQLSKWSLLNGMRQQEMSIETVVVIAGTLLIGIGFLVSRLFRPKLPAQQEIALGVNTSAIEQYGISPRELEILEAMSRGLSNKQIGAELYISENTVKSHVSKVLSKLDAERRTQAIQIARDERIIVV